MVGSTWTRKQRPVDLVWIGTAIHGRARRCGGTAAPALHGEFHVRPLDYRTAALFTPTLAGEDEARVYTILGGTPLYLRQWNPELDVPADLLALFGDSASSLVDSAELTLLTDLEDARAPYRALQAVALGATKHNEIRSQARARPILRSCGCSTSTCWSGAWRRPKYARYLIAERILRGDGVSSWWSNDGQHEIDIVGTAARRPTFIGSVKWRREPLGEAVLNDLERDAAGLGAPNIPRLLVGRGGVRTDVAARAGVRGVSADDLYR